jgi:hypothetical protein
MTDIGSSRPDQDTSRDTYGAARPRSSAWTGWVVFAAFLMLLNGAIQSLEGLMALVNPDYYHVTASGLAVSIDYSAWGWIHLIIGVALFASGMGVLSGNVLARTVGVLFVGLNALTALVFIEAAPGWGIILITLDVVVIYALTVHGRAMRDS